VLRAVGWPLSLAILTCVQLVTGCCQPRVNPPREDPPPEKTGETVVQPQEASLPSFVGLFTRASPSVVNVSAAHPLPIPEDLLPRRDREILRALVRSLGSGFVFDDQGHVATCSSVVQDADSIEVILANGRQLQATLVGSDEISDIAVLSIPRDKAPPPLPLGNSATLKTGDWVAAFGYPFGLSHSITAGIVSAVRSGEVLKAAHGLILSDASINPGCNGGPLLDTNGKVVGINLIPGQTEGSMGLAIPIEDALALLELLKTGHQPRRPWLGVAVQHVDSRLADSFDLPEAEGALVTRVVENGPAAKAGIQQGDVIIAFAGRTVEDPMALIEVVRGSRLDRKVKIRIVRKGKRKTLRIKPAASPP